MSAKVCLIGAGPSGMSVLCHIERLRLDGAQNLPHVTCYEKQQNWGGLWNFTWRTGLDEFGESVHNGMYHSLWSNGPKEALEYPDYTFEQHFGRPTPSFPPRKAMFDYLCGRWNKYNLKPKVTFSHAVRQVTFDPARNKFNVLVKDLKNDRVLDSQEFDYVINCTGHFSTPNIPYFKGFEQFPGRIMHSHDLRNWSDFTGKRLLVIGSSHSAHDTALQAMKFGATSVVCSYRTKPMNFNWPKGVTERPLVVEVDKGDSGRDGLARFKDGSTEKIDCIVLGTGYLHHYPYLSESLRLSGKNLIYPQDLYKGTVWMKDGNNRMLYLGAQDQYYSWTMFDAQALWAVKYLTGDIKMPDETAVKADVQMWLEKAAALKDLHEDIDFQTEFTVDLAKQAGYGYDLDVASWFHDWERHKDENIATYRDKQFRCKFTGNLAPPPSRPFMSALDDSMEAFLAACEPSG